MGWGFNDFFQNPCHSNKFLTIEKIDHPYYPRPHVPWTHLSRVFSSIPNQIWLNKFLTALEQDMETIQISKSFKLFQKYPKSPWAWMHDSYGICIGHMH